MDDVENLSHTKWECKYHVVFIPKYRRKVLFGNLREHLGPMFRRLAEQKDCQVEEGYLMVDHVHMMMSIPPKLAVSYVVGCIKGKSAIHIARTYEGTQRNYLGHHYLGPWILCIHERPRRADDPRLHQKLRIRRSEAGSAFTNEVRCHLNVALKAARELSSSQTALSVSAKRRKPPALPVVFHSSNK